jgi:hypothetical protein
MADKTLTVNGQPFTFNRDKFAGVRTMTVNGETVTVDRTAQVIDSDRKGESRPLLSKVVGGAAAAYSLRDLNDKQGNNKVVRVRRASDNHERDFLAKEVSNGTLQNWVNTQVVAPLDLKALTATGRDGAYQIAKAAYSLRSLGTRQATLAATGDTVARANGKFVAQVRRPSDDALKSFTAAEVTDGTLRNFCLNDDTDIISFADAGLAGSPAANKRIYFDGVNDSVSLGSNIVLAGDFEIESKILLQSVDIVGGSFPCLLGNGSSNRLFFSSGGTSLINDGTVSSFSGASLPLNTLTTVKLKRSGTTIELFFDGVSKGTSTNSASFTIGFLAGRSTTSGLIDGFIYDLSITSAGTLINSYNGYGNTSADWTDQTGSNNATVAGSPALFTGQGFDGFVKTWYDQSVTNQAGDTATGNHATQATAASQPKIVIDGSLNADGIKFDGVDDLLDIGGTGDNPLGIQSSNPLSIYTVAMPSNYSILGDNSNRDLRFLTYGCAYYLSTNPVGANGFSVPSTASVLFSTNHSGVGTEANVQISANGVVGNPTGSALGTTGANTAGSCIEYIGANIGNSYQRNYEKSVKELIIYVSDQTANRTALEANIGEAYSIDLPAGVDTGFDQVDGFVETWYDQSGNGADATQAVAGSQPKIVDGGALVTDSNNNPEIDFNGSNSFSFVNTTDSSPPYTVLSVSKVRDTGTNVIYGVDTGTTAGFYRQTGTTHALFSGGTSTGSAFAINTNYLRFDLFNGSSSVVGVNGDTTNVALTADRTNTGFRIAFSAVNSNQSIDGTIKEIILYQSDQSANRPAIEANINNQYEIY